MSDLTQEENYDQHTSDKVYDQNQTISDKVVVSSSSSRDEESADLSDTNDKVVSIVSVVSVAPLVSEQKSPNESTCSGSSVQSTQSGQSGQSSSAKSTTHSVQQNTNRAVSKSNINESVPETVSTTASTTASKQAVLISEVDQQLADNFAVLSYMDVQINLRLLADIKEGEKLMMADNHCITVDQRYVQAVRRYWTADSREKTLRFINHLIIAAKNYCDDSVANIKTATVKQIQQDNLERLINIQSLLRSATTGLGRMATTYADDKRNLATIETFKADIAVLCDQDLKRAISNNK